MAPFKVTSFQLLFIIHTLIEILPGSASTECALTFSKDCGYNQDIDNGSVSLITWEENAYCCNYVLHSQQRLFTTVTMVRDLNIVSLVSDYAFVTVVICVFVFQLRQNKSTKKNVLYLTAFGTLIDIIISFTIVGIISQNNLVTTVNELWTEGCYSEDTTPVLLGLKSQFETILILDVIEGVIDILSIVVLCCGKLFCKNNTLEYMTEGIHGFMFIVLDLLLVTVNVTVFVIPAYTAFV
eukprot:73695_1